MKSETELQIVSSKKELRKNKGISVKRKLDGWNRNRRTATSGIVSDQSKMNKNFQSFTDSNPQPMQFYTVYKHYCTNI